MVPALRVALLTLLLAVPAQAQDPSAAERIEIDTNLFCDTRAQVERFLALFNGNEGSAEDALVRVNAESGIPDACVIATAAYRRVGSVATVRNTEVNFDIMRIIVVGVYTLNGLEQSLPTEFFTLIPHEDEASTVGQRP